MTFSIFSEKLSTNVTPTGVYFIRAILSSDFGVVVGICSSGTVDVGSGSGAAHYCVCNSL